MLIIVKRIIYSDDKKSMHGLVGPFTTREEGYTWLESKGYTKIHDNKYQKPFGVGEFKHIVEEAYVGDVYDPDTHNP